MLKSGGGAIVNMSSILGAVGWENACAYVSTKHALIGLTKTAALEYAGHNIRINAAGSAFIDIPLLTKNLDAETVGQLAALHPIGRLGTAEEVSALTCFLLSANASSSPAATTSLMAATQPNDRSVVRSERPTRILADSHIAQLQK